MQMKKIRPSIIEIMMENASCNMNCKYCFGQFDDGINKHTNKIPEFNPKILDEKLADIDEDYNGDLKFWGGEPLLHFDILKRMIEYAKNKFKKAKLLVLTNGLLLSEDKSDFFIKNGVIVTISHDGYGQPNRGIDPLDFDKVINSIRKLKQADLFGGFHIVINKYSDELDKQFEYFRKRSKQIGFRMDISGSPINVTDEKTKIFQLRNEQYNKWIEYELLLAAERIKPDPEVGLAIGQEVSFSLLNLILGVKPSILCAAFNGRSVGLSGKIYRCVQDCERRSGIGDDHLKQANELELLPECYQCEFRYACCGGCPLNSNKERKINCERTKQSFKFTKEFIENTPGLFADLFDYKFLSGKVKCISSDDVIITSLER
jgi:uncharacterized protein